MQAVTCRQSLDNAWGRYQKAFHKSEISAHIVDSACIQSCMQSLGCKYQCILANLSQDARQHKLSSLPGRAQFWPSMCQKTLLVLDSPIPDNKSTIADLQSTCSRRQSGLKNTLCKTFV